MSTPTGKPARPASAFDYAPRRLREQWDRDGASNDADAESEAHLPRDLDEDPAPTPSRRHEDERSSLVPQGPHEHAEDDWDETEDAPALGWGDEPDHHPDSHERHAQTSAEDDAYEEQYEESDEQPHEAQHREQSRDAYDEPLERLAATLRSLQPEAGAATPKLPPAPQIRSATRGFQSNDAAAEREVYIDGTRLPRFLQASYVPPADREGGIGYLGAMLAVGIAILVAAPLTYYVAFGNPFASVLRDLQAKPKLEYTVASTSASLPRPGQTDPQPANAVAPSDAVAQPTPQLGPQSLTAVRPFEPRAQAPASIAAPRAVPLTHVMRWPDAGQAGGAAERARAPSVAPASAPPRADTAPAPAEPPLAALALAPASEPVPTRPAPPRPPVPAHSADEIDLWLKQGQDFISAGDVVTARMVLRRAAEAGVAVAALALARTYDPEVLAKMGARGVTPDVAEARHWYEMAQRLGSSEATQRLERLARDE